MAIITPNQTGLMSMRKSTGPTMGTTTKMISMKSRKKPSTNITSMITSMAPKTPPGRLVNRSATRASPPKPRNTREKMEAPRKITKTMVVILKVAAMMSSKMPARRIRANAMPRP